MFQLDGDYLTCTGETDVLKCKIYLERYSDKVYEGEVINVCGLVDATILLTVKKGQNIVINLNCFEDIRKEVNCVKEFPKNSDFEIYIMRNGTIGEEIYQINNKVKLINDKQNELDTNCEIDSSFFNCTTQSDAQNGKYLAKMESNYTIEREYSDIIIDNFTSSNYLEVNQYYVPLKSNNRIKVTHD